MKDAKIKILSLAKEIAKEADSTNDAVRVSTLLAAIVVAMERQGHFEELCRVVAQFALDAANNEIAKNN